MDLMSGLDKFGLNSEDLKDLYAEKEEKKEKKKPVKKTAKVEDESSYLYDRKMTCPVCEREFLNKTVKTSKVRLVGTDNDMRPIYKDIDTIKYGVTSCPHCGYSALNKSFLHISLIQIKLVREQVASRFRPSGIEQPDIFTYDYAIEQFKLALFSTVVKRARTSEKAYICLKMAWLFRGKSAELRLSGYSSSDTEVQEAVSNEMSYYEQALDGFSKSISEEPFPICGMDMDTMDLLLAQMYFRVGKYELSAKLVSRILVSRTANRHIKDKALDLKDELKKKLRAED